MPPRRYPKGYVSVTTILGGLGWNTEALLNWANRMGQEGRHHREASAKEATVGTVGHAWIEADLKGEDFDVHAVGLPEEDIPRAERAFNAWQQWKRLNELRVIESECALLHDELMVSGTVDVVAEAMDPNGDVAILDFKTGGVYPEQVAQIAAYGKLYEHISGQKGERRLVTEYHLLRVSKESGHFQHTFFPAKEVEFMWTDVFLPLVHDLPRSEQGEEVGVTSEGYQVL